MFNGILMSCPRLMVNSEAIITEYKIKCCMALYNTKESSARRERTEMSFNSSYNFLLQQKKIIYKAV